MGPVGAKATALGEGEPLFVFCSVCSAKLRACVFPKLSYHIWQPYCVVYLRFVVT